MKVALIFWGILAFVAVCNAAEDFEKILSKHGNTGYYDGSSRLDMEDASLTVPEIVAKYGYPIEVHEITTAGGYVLTFHRIPYGKLSGPSENRPVVWLQHGLLCDSSNWIMNNEDKALAYVLANLGYDVWMGNARGNTYSRKHVSLSPKDSEFWQFSWNEMGTEDFGSNLDYILNATGQSDLYYVGHSMGTTMFWVAMSEQPELNSKIRLMSALAPISYVEHMFSPIALIAPFCNQLEWVLSFMGADEFMPTSDLMELLGKTLCHENNPINGVCANVLFLIAGYDVEQLNKTSLPIILGHTPSGASVKSLVHYAQGVNSGIFGKYDFGKKENLEKYGQEKPPAYDLTKITAPVALYWANNDALGPPADVYRMSEQLPNLVRKFRVPHDRYNHLDFLWAMDNDKILNNYVVDFMEYF